MLALGLIGHGMYQRRWGRVVVAGGLLLLLALRFGPRLAAWSRVSPSVEDLQVMTLNVPPTFGADSPGSLAALVGTEEPNLLAFQESRFWTGDPASSPSLTRVSLSLRPLLSDSVGYAPPRQLPANTEIQQPVLGRPVPESLSVHPLPPRGKTDARSRYTRTQLTWRGRPAALYNVHLHTVGAARPWEITKGQVFSLSRWRTFFQTYREGALRRAQQARLLRRAIEREDRPVIVVGDFNSTPTNGHTVILLVGYRAPRADAFRDGRPRSRLGVPWCTSTTFWQVPIGELWRPKFRGRRTDGQFRIIAPSSLDSGGRPTAVSEFPWIGSTVSTRTGRRLPLIASPTHW
jgi:endonuclease/exonuclease/phosphatase family metal-dependent hydrolase